jgi:hypothetical protein
MDDTRPGGHGPELPADGVLDIDDEIGILFSIHLLRKLHLIPGVELEATTGRKPQIFDGLGTYGPRRRPGEFYALRHKHLQE